MICTSFMMRVSPPFCVCRTSQTEPKLPLPTRLSFVNSPETPVAAPLDLGGAIVAINDSGRQFRLGWEAQEGQKGVPLSFSAHVVKSHRGDSGGSGTHTYRYPVPGTVGQRAAPSAQPSAVVNSDVWAPAGSERPSITTTRTPSAAVTQ